MSEQEILNILKDGPRIIHGGPPRDIYFDMQERGLITMKHITIDSQETAIEVRLTEQSI